MPSLNRYLIIPAAGTGKRFGSKIPKQFLPVAGMPLLMHTILPFYRFDKKIRIILALPFRYISYWHSLCRKYNFHIPHRVVKGGKTRFHSVKNGLRFVPKRNCIVAVHDAVRPFVHPSSLRLLFKKTLIHGAAVPALKPVDSMRIVTGRWNSPVNRESFRLIQTPQCFRAEIMHRAYNQKFRQSFTDDANAVEKAGYSLHLVETSTNNFKITFPVDFDCAELLIKMNGKKN